MPDAPTPWNARKMILGEGGQLSAASPALHNGGALRHVQLQDGGYRPADDREDGEYADGK